MATKKQARRFITIIAEPRIGPDPHGIRYCMRCMEPIKPGEHWQRIDRGRGAVAVGVHNRCRVYEVQP